ncbi:adenine phosphoribosyltransferase [Acetobacter tropicalis]|nr:MULTISPECIES: adenine phosphoribosyltransferase [Acetobacter]MCG4253933.1 adenine phosphoribosyltransferase [Acetobacter senegalensis]MCP1194438.1 adenine phosphoribosyltransferase [Acetobacter senegalensis]MDN7355289.1 adenine phosphoribosyltransferase [Acetobacter senegalensis]
MTKREEIDLKRYIRNIPDFPKPGILFYDISTLMREPDAWQIAMGRLARQVAPWEPDMLAAVESRGFLTAAPLADRLGCGLLMLRKPGKLPGGTISHTYDLEYGSDTLQIQDDAIKPGQRVVVMDDLLATGGTLAASITLLRKAGANVVGASLLVELTGLGGREKLDVPVKSLVTYEE